MVFTIKKSHRLKLLADFMLFAKKLRCFLKKKKSSVPISRKFCTFRLKIVLLSKKKKKKLPPEIIPRFFTFCPRIEFSKKKGYHFKALPDFAILA